LKTLKGLLEVFGELSTTVPIVFPVHPRSQAKIRDAGLGDFFERPGIKILPPLGYFEMLGLIKGARFVLTDSGGVQEETTALGVPCITLRENTERPITLTEGTNTLVGTSPQAIRDAVDQVLKTGGKTGRQPELWDGHAADRIADDLNAWLG
jgi:UDP-N-acetylglucosamine 2-epimerase (non-hydrolysing)